MSFRRYILPEVLILESALRAHPHAPAGLHTYADFCTSEEIDQSRGEDAWVLQLTPEAGVQFHSGTFHPYLAVVHDLHIHWNYLNTFPPGARNEKHAAFRRLIALPLPQRRRYFADQDIGHVLEGTWCHHAALQVLARFFPGA